MSLQEVKTDLAVTVAEIILTVPESQAANLFSAAAKALSLVNPENVDELTRLLNGFSNSNTPAIENKNLVDAKDMAEAMEWLKTGKLNLPGGGTIELTEKGVDIKGPVNLSKLTEFSNGERGTFNLTNFEKFGIQDASGLSITMVVGNGFKKNKLEAETYVGGADKLPTAKNATLALFAAQFLPEFQAIYQHHNCIAVRTNSRFVFYAYKDRGADWHVNKEGQNYIGALALCTENLK